MRDKVISLYNLLFFKYWFLILFFSLWKFYGFAHPTAWEGKAPGWIKSFLKGPGGSWSPRLLPGPACEGWSGDHPSPGLRGSPGSHWAAVCVARSPGLAQVLHSTRMPLPPRHPPTHTHSPWPASCTMGEGRRVLPLSPTSYGEWSLGPGEAGVGGWCRRPDSRCVSLGRSDAVGSGVPVWSVIGCHPQQRVFAAPRGRGRQRRWSRGPHVSLNIQTPTPSAFSGLVWS